MRRPTASLSIPVLLVLGACAHGQPPAAEPAAGAAPAEAAGQAETGEGEAAAEAPAYGPCDEFEYVARGHAFARRLVCPNDTFATGENVGTKVLDDGRFLDSYVVSCPDLGRLRFEAPVDCSEPEVPKGLRLVPPEVGKAWIQANKRMWDADDVPGALEALERAANVAPDVADVQALLGLALARQGRVEEGVAALDRALGAADDYLWRIWRGTLRYRLERYEEAVEDLRQAARLAPERAEKSKTLHEVLGESLHRLGRDEAATPHRRRACELGHAPSCQALGLPPPAPDA